MTGDLRGSLTENHHLSAHAQRNGVIAAPHRGVSISCGGISARRGVANNWQRSGAASLPYRHQNGSAYGKQRKAAHCNTAFLKAVAAACKCCAVAQQYRWPHSVCNRTSYRQYRQQRKRGIMPHHGFVAALHRAVA